LVNLKVIWLIEAQDTHLVRLAVLLVCQRLNGFIGNSAHVYDKAILARGGKRISGAVAMGAAIGGVRGRTTSGLNKGKSGGIHQY
jgi:hypothetical protein